VVLVQQLERSTEDFILLPFWHLKRIKRPRKLSRKFIKLGRRNFQLAMCLFETL
jgi:hypothetical protein